MKTKLFFLLMVFGRILFSDIDGWVQAQEITTSIIEIDEKIKKLRKDIENMEEDREFYRDLLQKLESGEYVSTGGLFPVPKDYASNVLAAQVVYGLITKEQAVEKAKFIAQLTKAYIEALKPEIDIWESVTQEIRRSLVDCLNQRAVLINQKLEPESSSTPCTWRGQWKLNLKDNETGKEDVILTLTQSGNTVQGHYSLWYHGNVSNGKVNGLTLEGDWSNSYNGGDGGTFTITMSPDCKSWSGSWKSTKSGDAGSWSGTRIGN